MFFGLWAAFWSVAVSYILQTRNMRASQSPAKLHFAMNAFFVVVPIIYIAAIVTLVVLESQAFDRAENALIAILDLLREKTAAWTPGSQFSITELVAFKPLLATYLRQSETTLRLLRDVLIFYAVAASFGLIVSLFTSPKLDCRSLKVVAVQPFNVFAWLQCRAIRAVLSDNDTRASLSVVDGGRASTSTEISALRLTYRVSLSSLAVVVLCEY
jgi:hypothetical protein